MGALEESNEDRTVYCGNLSEEVTDDILLALCNQAGPVESVRRPKDPNGRPKPFGFVVYKHEESVPYAIELFRGVKLFKRNLVLNSRSTLIHFPVLDTQMRESINPAFMIPSSFQGIENRSFENNNWRSSHDNEFANYQRNSSRNHRENESRESHHRERGHRKEGSSGHRHRNKNNDSKGPTNWAEFNVLRGRGTLDNHHVRDDLQGPSERPGRSDPSCSGQMTPNFNGMWPMGEQSNPNSSVPTITDFNALLQLGQQMMIPGMMGVPRIMPMAGGMPLSLGLSLGGTSIPSMQGSPSGGERNTSSRENRRRDNHEERNNRRDRPYDRPHNDHRPHDRRYSSSRSSHDNERKNRRSR